MNRQPLCPPPLPNTRFATWRACAVILLAVVLIWVAYAPSASAATITVTTTADENNNDGDCSLREAVIAANSDVAVDDCAAGNGTDTIVLPAGDYVFDPALGATEEDFAATGDLDVFQSVTIVGAGRLKTTIDANGLDRVFHIRGETVTLIGMTVTNGDAHESSGGGILVATGGLTLQDSRVTGNTTGISTTYYDGGGIYYSSADTPLTILDSRIDNNSAVNRGGGIYLSSISTLKMDATTVGYNTSGSGSGISNHGTATIVKSLVAGNVASSTSSGGGGISSNGPLALVNSTLSGNSSVNSGGGLMVGSGSVASLFNVTITNNTANSDADIQGDGGGIRIAFGTVNMQNTLLAGNFDGSTIGDIHPDCSGTGFTSLDFNLIGDATGCTIGGQKLHNLSGVNPKLEPLKNNGGSTLTHALNLSSPAVDAGNTISCLDETGSKLTEDQRGFVRPVNGDGALTVVCDIGAFEVLSPGAPTPRPTATATMTPTTTNTPTATIIATATEGPSPTSAPTITPGPSPTPSATATDGPSPTATITATATDGPSPTPTATDGPSPTATATAAEGPSPTPSATATVGPSPAPFMPSYWIHVPVTVN